MKLKRMLIIYNSVANEQENFLFLQKTYNSMKKISVLLLSILMGINVFSQKQTETKATAIKWYSFEEAIKLNKEYPKKKIFVDVYTDWCGWCKRMDATTFSQPDIIEYMNANFYAVKLDAERKDSLIIDDKLFINPNPTGNRSTHQIAEMLLNGRMSYPSYVFLDEMSRPITVVPGFVEASAFEPILHYFAENEYFKKSWEAYQKDFVGKIKK